MSATLPSQSHGWVHDRPTSTADVKVFRFGQVLSETAVLTHTGPVSCTSTVQKLVVVEENPLQDPFHDSGLSFFATRARSTVGIDRGHYCLAS